MIYRYNKGPFSGPFSLYATRETKKVSLLIYFDRQDVIRNNCVLEIRQGLKPRHPAAIFFMNPGLMDENYLAHKVVLLALRIAIPLNYKALSSKIVYVHVLLTSCNAV